MTPEDCLPEALKRGAAITRIAAGLSGAGVYRVDSAGARYVLKIAAPDESEAAWRSAVELEELAAASGLAPRVVHVDQARRAVLAEFVEDRSFARLLFDPRTRDAALELLGHTVRRVHALPIPADAPVRDPRAFLRSLWAELRSGFVVPESVREAVERALAEAPAAGRVALCHNDLNPSNLIHDGERLLLLDWAAAGRNDPLYDLATLAVFLRLDAPACLRVISAYEGRPVAALAPELISMRRLAATLAGTMQLRIARALKHPGSALESPLALGEFYQRMRAGELELGTPEGQWAFGLALVSEGNAV